ncbi:hypothetical protein CWB41_15970 [Methylovirgula ligni]|nr:hypothetical protein [Methylovirgula ligni]QAY97048.1 hypothetical protein CWB41_15970 [Methylovirgula ligni]
MEAARRQIEAAIRMTFAGADPTATHSVAAAARGIIADLAEEKQIESYLCFTDWIAPGHESEFWNAMNHSANFLKHADRDPVEILKLDEEETDFVILFAAKWYRDLSGESNRVLSVFILWFSIKHPGVLGDAAKAALQSAGFLDQMEQAIKHASVLSRENLLLLGQKMLEMAEAR